MKIKNLILFGLFAVCIHYPLSAQTPLTTWDDLNAFLRSTTDTSAVFTGTISANNNTPPNNSNGNQTNATSKTIDGEGYTLDGSLSTLYMSIGISPSLAATTTISNLTFANFSFNALSNQDYNNGPVTAVVNIGPNVIFSHNGTLNNPGGAIENEFYTTFAPGTQFLYNKGQFGGAIYNKDYMDLGDGVIFDHNSSSLGGGAIGTSTYGLATNPWQTIIGNNAQFTNNSDALWGGAIDNQNTDVEIGANAYFYKNTGGYYGGAIYANMDDHTSNVPNTSVGPGAVFESNSAAYYGGAIDNEFGTMTIGDNATFKLNNTQYYGAAIANGPVSATNTGTGTGTLIVGNNAQFVSNTANVGGGAIYNNGTAATATVGTGALFSQNTGTKYGGVIYNYLGVVSVGAGANFSNNTASAAGGAGGAIYNYDGTINLDTAAGKTTLFTGNADSSGVNDIYMGYVSHLPVMNITGGGTIKFDDGFRSNSSALVHKTSSGEMILGANSQNARYVGTFTQDAGITSVYSTNFFMGTDNINNSLLHFYTTNTANVLNVNGGTVDLRSSTAGAYDALTTNAWAASGAKLNINTYLGGEDLAGIKTDKLVIASGGSISGDSTLFVTSTGTNNLATPDGSNGILVVDASQSATNTASFVLNGGQIDTGALVYKLNHPDQNWYLKTDGELTNTADTVANMPALHLTLVKTAMSELRRRLGDLWTDDTGCRPNNIWARVYGRRLNVDDKIEADMTLYGAQAGVDTRVFAGDGSRMYAGLMGGYMYTGNIKVKQSTGSDGTGTGKVPSAGVYGVWFNEDGWFTDLTAQYFWAQMKMNNISAAQQVIDYDTDRDLWSAGLEGGKSIPVSSFVLTPKAQVLFAHGAPASHATNMADNVYYGGTDSLTAAVRLQGTYLKHGADSRWQPFAEVGLYNEFMGKTDINFAGVGMKSDVGGAGFEAALGTNLRLGNSSVLFGDVSYEIGGVYRAFAANLGARLAFGGKNCDKCRAGRKDNCPVKQKESPAAAQNTVSAAPAVVAAAPPVQVIPAPAQTAAPAANAAAPQIPVIYFGSDKYNLTPVAGTDIKGIVDTIKKSGLKFEVRGYTDSTGPGWYNNNLSKLRAYTIYNELQAAGVPSRQLIYKGFGAANPADPAKTPEAYAKNRRVEIVPVR